MFGLIGLCDAEASAAGMIHPADQGFQVINMSYAGPSGSAAEQSPAAYAWGKGVVLVAAAANSFSTMPMYPAAFGDVIAVAATDYFDNLAGFSSFGNTWMSLAAPGDTIFGTLPHTACGLPQSDPEGCYGWLSGTSMASPMVAGATAVLWSYQGGAATNVSVRNALEANADTIGALGQNMLAGTANGRLNLLAALENGSIPASPSLPSSDPGIHVGDLDGVSLNAGSTWMAEITVTVHDENHAPVGGIIVTGSWTGGAAGAGDCNAPTNASGQCSMIGPPVAKRIGAVSFSVGSLEESLAYQSAANHDDDGDSDGTNVTVVK